MRTKRVRYLHKFHYYKFRLRYCEAVLRYIERWGFHYIFISIIARHADYNLVPTQSGEKIIDLFLMGELDGEILREARGEAKRRFGVGFAETTYRSPLRKMTTRPKRRDKAVVERRYQREDAETRLVALAMALQQDMPVAGTVPANEEGRHPISIQRKEYGQRIRHPRGVDCFNNRWRARFRGKYLGSFGDKDSAARAYAAAKNAQNLPNQEAFCRADGDLGLPPISS
jgi:hypothetical protein